MIPNSGQPTPDQKEAFARMRAWKRDPVKFVYDLFGVTPDTWQAEALRAFANTDDPQMQRISLQACAGPGKSAVMAWCIWNFLLCYGEIGDHPNGAAISITAGNLKDNLWKELAKWHGRSQLLQEMFTVTSERIFAKDHEKTWWVSARSFAQTANADEQGRTLSGLHSGYVLAIIDESGDIPPSVLRAAEQTLSTKPKFGKIIQAGNPTSNAGMLYAAASKLRSQWHVIRITGDPDDKRRSPRIDAEWAAGQIKNYGRDDPWVKAYILGEFPPGSINTLLSVEDVEAAMSRTLKEDAYVYSQKRLGCDFARFGDDRTILFPRQGLAAFRPIEMRSARSNDIAARIMLARERWQQEIDLCDDSGGYGSGVIDSLIQAGQSPIPVNFAGKAEDPRYLNKRAEIWFRMAEWIKRGGAIPSIPGLVEELTQVTYTFVNGKFQIEPKERIKERLRFSPDMADALALTFALPEMPASNPYNLPAFKKGSAVKAEYDPYAESRL